MILALCIIALLILMLIILVELYFIIKRIVLRYEFQQQKIKDKKYTSALYRFYVYSKYHSKTAITDFILEFKNFYELDNLDKLDDEYKEFNIKRTMGFSRDISALTYKKRLNANLSGNKEELQNNILINLEELNTKLNNIQDQPNLSIIATPVEESTVEESIENKVNSNIKVRVNNAITENPTVNKRKEKVVKEKVVKEKVAKVDKKEKKAEKPDKGVYFDENDSLPKVKQSKKEIAAMEKNKKDQAALKKLMSDI